MLLLVAQGIGWITCVDKVIKGLAAQPTVTEDWLWPTRAIQAVRPNVASHCMAVVRVRVPGLSSP